MDTGCVRVHTLSLRRCEKKALSACILSIIALDAWVDDQPFQIIQLLLYLEENKAFWHQPFNTDKDGPHLHPDQ